MINTTLSVLFLSEADKVQINLVKTEGLNRKVSEEKGTIWKEC